MPGSTTTVAQLGAFVSELFGDRLERETRERRLAPLPAGMLSPAAASEPDRARTIQIATGGPIPALPKDARPTDTVTPPSRAELQTREARSTKRGDGARPYDETLRLDDGDAQPA